MRTKTIKIRVDITETGYTNIGLVLKEIKRKLGINPYFIVKKIWIAHK